MLLLTTILRAVIGGASREVQRVALFRASVVESRECGYARSGIGSVEALKQCAADRIRYDVVGDENNYW